MAKVGSKFCQILNEPKKIFRRLPTFIQSGKIWPIWSHCCQLSQTLFSLSNKKVDFVFFLFFGAGNILPPPFTMLIEQAMSRANSAAVVAVATLTVVSARWGISPFEFRMQMRSFGISCSQGRSGNIGFLIPSQSF